MTHSNKPHPLFTNPRGWLNPSRASLAQLALVVITLLWGATLPLSVIANQQHPIWPIAARFIIASLPLLPALRKLNRALLRDGIQLGILGFFVYAGQMMALQTIGVNRTAILGAMNIIIVPILLKLTGRHVPRLAFVLAGLALAGLLIMKPDLRLTSWAIGDLWAFVSAAAFALLTLKLEGCTTQHDSLKLTEVQLVTIAVISTVIAQPTVQTVREVLADPKVVASLVYLGLGATLLTTFLQAKAQRYVSSCQSTTILSLEPLTTALFGWLLLAQSPSLNELIGGALVIVAGLFMPPMPFGGHLTRNPWKNQKFGVAIFTHGAALRRAPEVPMDPPQINEAQALERFIPHKA